ncbi:MAG: hypothetical protein KDD73_14990 [Anaerolineales bacterium]|nr:hypothetical protein [Candidatus Saccharibacteria bacterium]MCB0078715.1 hypothetical protein [Anaerolineales bacterium]
MSDKEQAVDMAQAWGPYTTDSEKDEIETETWDLDAIKVWPAGKSGPALPLTELAAWRQEAARLKRALDE